MHEEKSMKNARGLLKEAIRINSSNAVLAIYAKSFYDAEIKYYDAKYKTKRKKENGKMESSIAKLNAILKGGNKNG